MKNQVVEIEMIDFDQPSRKDRFNYMMLGKLQSDCEAHLGISNRMVDNINEHIQDMKDLWNGFKIKPVWLTMEQIETYEKRMLEE